MATDGVEQVVSVKYLERGRLFKFRYVTRKRDYVQVYRVTRLQ